MSSIFTDIEVALIDGRTVTAVKIADRYFLGLAEITHLVAWETWSHSPGRSLLVPLLYSSMRSARAGGRGRLPVCVVRMRSVLRCMATSPAQAPHVRGGAAGGQTV